MVPQNLNLTNFMSYGEGVPELDFSGLHTFCLSGDNGNGKSALLDAMTWALWGQARSTSQDEVIRLGAIEARVEFKFLYENQIYRVIRSRTKKGRGKTSLEFQVQNEDGEFRPLTESTITKTEKKITETLRMDYETFINSAFLVQGRADEFTQKSPGKRKEILAEILRLSVYDDLTEKAREHRKVNEGKIESLELDIAEIDQELEHKPEYESEIKSLRDSVTEIEVKIKDKEKEFNEKQKTLTLLESKQKRIKEIKSRIAEIEEEMRQMQSRIQRLEKNIAKSTKILENEREIEDKLEKLERARSEESKWTERLTRQLTLTKEKNRLEQLLKDKERDIRNELQKFTTQRSEIEKVLKGAKELNEKIDSLKASLKKAQEAEKERDEIQQRGKNNSAQIKAIGQRNEQILKDIAKIENKAAQLQGEEAKCPLCDQDLTPEHRSKVRSKYSEEIEQCRSAIAEGEKDIRRLEQEKEKLRPRYFELDKLSKKIPEIQRQLGMIEQKQKDAAEAEEKLPSVIERIEQIEKVLNDKSYAKSELTELEEIDTKIVENDYRKDVHQKVRAEIDRLKGVESQKMKLDRARSVIELDKEQVTELKKALDSRRQAVIKERQAKEALEKEVADISEIENLVSSLSRELEKYRAELAEMRQKLGKVSAKFEHCELREKEKSSKQKEKNQAAKDAKIYKELEIAFGKNGIQAIIIENALSEIEDEANRLLGLLTENSMHVTIETQRESKTAGTIETLDIKLSDDVGTRKYELYSGGEKFRADFAIRIALSRLLARRAGAKLECLIVDEGFGTQDSSGREHLIEAINAISSDFRMIIVITHIEELRDAFPARIEVDKVPGRGSIFTVV